MNGDGSNHLKSDGVSATMTSGAGEKNHKGEEISSLPARGLNHEMVDPVERKQHDHGNGANESSISSTETEVPSDSVMPGPALNESNDTYHDTNQALEGDEGDEAHGTPNSLPTSEPQAASSADGSNAEKEGGLENEPIDDGQQQQQDPIKSDSPVENGLLDADSNLLACEGWNPLWNPRQSLQVQVKKQQDLLVKQQEEIKKFKAREEEMKVQLNQLQQEKEKLLVQILHLENQHAAKSLQGGSYLDDSKAATPALLGTAVKTVRGIGKKFTKEFMDQLKMRPEDVRLPLEDHILKQVAVGLSRPTHKKFQYQAYMNHKLFVGFDHPTFYMMLEDIDEPPLEFSPMQKSEWYRKDNFQKFQKYDLRKFSVKMLVENAEHDSFLREFCFMKFLETFDELTEKQLFGHLQHRNCILKEKKHPTTAFYESFCKLAISVWLLHKLAFAFKTPATTFVMEKGLPFDHQKMQSAGPSDDITPNSRVGLVVLPGFQVSQSIIACEVYLVEQA